MDQKDLENRFNYHKPDEDKAKLEEVMFWSNSAIARND
jgi:hypothetical protein